MDQLIQEISTKTGITDAQARQAVQMVVNFVKQRLPPQLAGQVDALLAGQGATGQGGNDMMGQAMGELGGMFGKKE